MNEAVHYQENPFISVHDSVQSSLNNLLIFFQLMNDFIFMQIYVGKYKNGELKGAVDTLMHKKYFKL